MSFCNDSADVVSSAGLCKSASVFQISKEKYIICRIACFAYMQGRHYLSKAFHAHPLGNPEWQDTALSRTRPTEVHVLRAEGSLW